MIILMSCHVLTSKQVFSGEQYKHWLTLGACQKCDAFINVLAGQRSIPWLKCTTTNNQKQQATTSNHREQSPSSSYESEDKHVLPAINFESKALRQVTSPKSVWHAETNTWEAQTVVSCSRSCLWLRSTTHCVQSGKSNTWNCKMLHWYVCWEDLSQCVHFFSGAALNEATMQHPGASVSLRAASSLLHHLNVLAMPKFSSGHHKIQEIPALQTHGHNALHSVTESQGVLWGQYPHRPQAWAEDWIGWTWGYNQLSRLSKAWQGLTRIDKILLTSECKCQSSYSDINISSSLRNQRALSEMEAKQSHAPRAGLAYSQGPLLWRGHSLEEQLEIPRCCACRGCSMLFLLNDCSL